MRKMIEVFGHEYDFHDWAKTALETFVWVLAVFVLIGFATIGWCHGADIIRQIGL